MAAINDGLPELLTAGKKLELAGKAVVLWVQTGAEFVESAASSRRSSASRAVCVAVRSPASSQRPPDPGALRRSRSKSSASVSASAGTAQARSEAVSRVTVTHAGRA